jgi:transposase
MPQVDYSAKLLDMEDIELKEVLNESSHIQLRFRLRLRDHECPVCHALTRSVHDYRLQTAKDIPFQGKPVYWLYEKRRYRCRSCGKRFYEKNYLLPKFHRITNRMALLCLNELQYKCSRKDIAQRLGISQSTVARWMQLADYGRPSKLPKVLSIDEFRGNTDAGKFQCILTSPKDKAIVDILPDRTAAHILDYLKSFPNKENVKYMVMDMNKEYLRIAQTLFKNAIVVIDRFHVVRYCTWALDNVRKRIQKSLLPDQRKYFKRSRRLLLAHMAHLSDDNKRAVEHMLLFSRDLREAYLLKEAFYRFMSSSDSLEAKQRLQEFRMYTFTADIPEFKACLIMLKNWEPYILNAFDCPFSNGFTEGVNNTIKVLKRVAYGYRSFDNFRRRILMTLNANRAPATNS